VKTDSVGTIHWAKNFTGPNDCYGYGGQQTTDGGYIIAGYSLSGSVYLIKLNANGIIAWIKTILPPYGAYVYSIQQTADGGYVLSGYTYEPFYSYNFYLVKTDSVGNAACGMGTVNLVAVELSHAIANTPLIVSAAATVVSVPAVWVSSEGNVTTFCSTVGIDNMNNNSKSGINIFPNPAQSSFTISLNDNFVLTGIPQLKIFDITGRVVHQQAITNQNSEINVVFSSGVYFVKVNDGEKHFVQKLIIE
jgi:hypothetical protein